MPKHTKRRKKKKTKCLQLKYSDPTFNSISVARSGEAQPKKKVHIVKHIVVRMAMDRDLNLAYSAITSDFTTWKVVLLML